MTRKIIHIDMDSFFASVEIRDDPRLNRLPVAVGGAANSRGIICTANYEARKYGVHSAMPTYQAQRLCPHLRIIKPNIKKYREISKNIRYIFSKYSDLVEPISIDEAYIDVTDPKVNISSATLIAQNIKEQIYESERLTASAGVSINKLIAKIASDFNKPNGITVIPPEKITEFMQSLPVKSISGVGPTTAKKMHMMGIKTCHDIQQMSKEDLYSDFGKFGIKLFDYCRGVDNRELKTERTHKSISVEHTYSKDLLSIDCCQNEMKSLIKRLCERVSNEEMLGKIKTIFIKVKFNDFRQTTLDKASFSIDSNLIMSLLENAYLKNSKPVRLMGVGVRFGTNSKQLAFDFSGIE